MAFRRVRSACSISLLALVIGGLGTGCSDDSQDEGAPTEATAQIDVDGEPANDPGLRVPDRQPDVTGVVGFGDEFPSQPHLVQPSDEYFLGMDVLRGDPVLVGPDGALPYSALDEGEAIALWIDGGCNESFPVQCRVVAVTIAGPSG